MVLAAIVIANVLSGVVAVWMAMAIISMGMRARRQLVSWLVDFAIGTLLGSAFLDVIPAALDAAPAGSHHTLLLAVLLGLLGFIALERLIAWRHCHVADCSRHGKESEHFEASVPIVMLGDGLHNFVDGVVIAAAFLSDMRVGVTVTFAVLLHELPQEMADFGVLLRSGLSSRRALVYNTLGALTAIAGGVVAYFALDAISPAKPFVLAVAAAGFIYLALADLVPSRHDARLTGARTVAQLALIAAGVLVVVLSHTVLRD